MTDRISEIEELIQSRERFALEADTSPKFEETTETLRYLLAHDAAISDEKPKIRARCSECGRVSWCHHIEAEADAYPTPEPEREGCTK